MTTMTGYSHSYEIASGSANQTKTTAHKAASVFEDAASLLNDAKEEVKSRVDSFTKAKSPFLRELEPDELAKIAKQETHWFPAFFVRLGTPVIKKIASPFRWGILMGAAGGGLTTLLSAVHELALPTKAVLTTGVSLFSGKLGRMYREAMNDEAKYLMRSLPKDATEADARSLSVYQDQLREDRVNRAMRENFAATSLMLHDLSRQRSRK